MSKEDVIQLRVELHDKVAKKFLMLKERLGFTNNSDLVRMIIARTYEEEFGKP